MRRSSWRGSCGVAAYCHDFVDVSLGGQRMVKQRPSGAMSGKFDVPDIDDLALRADDERLSVTRRLGHIVLLLLCAQAIKHR